MAGHKNRWERWRGWVVTTFGPRVEPRPDTVLETLPADRVPWSFKVNDAPVVAIGDVHGDVVALASILHNRRLIDDNGRWQGGETQVVLNGDLVGGADSRVLVEMVMRLHREARRCHGAVHALLGNHDILALHRQATPKEKKLFKKLPVAGSRKKSMRGAFRGETAWAAWVRRRNAIIRIGPVLFAHAGINTWARYHHPRRINATVRAWIRHWQGLEPAPPPQTQWVVASPEAIDWAPSSSGPLWTRSFKAQRFEAQDHTLTLKRPERAPDAVSLQQILKKHRCQRLVIGHAPIENARILLAHPYYGRSLVMIDTRISDKKNGRLSCLEICRNEWLAHYPKRSKAGKVIRDREFERLKKTT